MSGDLSQVKHRRTATAQGRVFLNTRILKRDASQGAVQVGVGQGVGQAPQQKAAYEAALAKAKPTFKAADLVISRPNIGPTVLNALGGYLDAAAKLQGDESRVDYAKTLLSLQAKLAAANTILLAKAQDDAAAQKQKQFDTQVAQYDAMAPELSEVKRTYLAEGGAKRIEKQGLASEKEFKDFLAALQTLEAAKSGVKPDVPVAKQAAVAIKANCDDVVAKAQAYLTLYEGLPDPKKASKDNLSKKRICEETIISARQYGLAMDLDAIGKPSANNPWDHETTTRVASIRAAFSYEQGYSQAKGLDDGGGASDSYWIKSGNLNAGQMNDGKLTFDAKKRGDFIFKPFEGETAPDGGSDKPGAGATKEAFASANAKLFAAQTGIDLGVPETSVAAIGQHAIPGGDPTQPPVIGSVQQHAGAATQIKDLPRDTFKNIKAGEVQKIALMDIMSLSMDRHGGNIMVDGSDPTNPKLIPIDHGATLPSRKDFPALKNRMAGLDPLIFSESATPVNTLLQIPSAFEPFDPETTTKLQQLDPDAIEADMKAQRTALDTVHPDLGAGEKVGDDSLHMSKRSMMFLKKAAKILSPAEIQIALGVHGEALFDAADNQFDTVADQVIADMSPKKALYQEIFSMSAKQQYDMHEWLKNNGWAQGSETGKLSASTFIMNDPQSALDIYKNKTPNPNVVKTPLDRPNGNALMTQNEFDAMILDFPNCKLTMDTGASVMKPETAAWAKLATMGGKAAVDQVVLAVGGKPPTRPGGAVVLLQAWAALQTPAYAQERAALAPDPTKGCVEILTELMKGTASKIQATQQAANAQLVAAALDPAVTAKKSAKALIDEARANLAGFEDATATPPLAARCQALDTRHTQGPAQNETPLAFGKALEADARSLSSDVTEAALRDVLAAANAIAAQLKTVTPPNDDTAIRDYDAAVKSASNIAEMAGPAGSLWFTRNELQSLKAQAPQVIAAGNPVVTQPVQVNGGAPVNQDDDDDEDDAPLQAAPLAVFTWRERDASAAKKQAVAERLFKDKDTGMTAALKSVKSARDTLAGMKPTVAAPKKIETLEKTIAAYGKFGIFVASKLRVLSRDPKWSGYCDSASELVEQEIQALRARIAAIQNGTGG